MPYFVFRIEPDQRMQHLETFTAFREAMSFARKLRSERAPDAEYEVRMIFADDPAEGRRLLSTRRKASPVEEWEM
ncbi:MAG: hypothetical protein LJE84_08265 [Gammaproteobacteria bacterium]|nr:hypothetical protein [Gammaproteobacteria bacterium]